MQGRQGIYGGSPLLERFNEGGETLFGRVEDSEPARPPRVIESTCSDEFPFCPCKRITIATNMKKRFTGQVGLDEGHYPAAKKFRAASATSSGSSASTNAGDRSSSSGFMPRNHLRTA